MSCEEIRGGNLDAYVSGELPRADRRRVEAHLFGCSECAGELRRLRAEQRLFRARAEQDTAPLPSFEEVLARAGVEPVARAGVEQVARRARSGWAARLAPAGVAVAALAAAAASWVGVRPAAVEVHPGARGEAAEVEIGPDRVCATESPGAGELLACMPPVRSERQSLPHATLLDPPAPAGEEPAPRAPEVCASGDGPAAEACGEAVTWCEPAQ